VVSTEIAADLLPPLGRLQSRGHIGAIAGDRGAGDDTPSARRPPAAPRQSGHPASAGTNGSGTPHP
jgi:hypothetical protein